MLCRSPLTMRRAGKERDEQNLCRPRREGDQPSVIFSAYTHALPLTPTTQKGRFPFEAGTNPDGDGDGRLHADSLRKINHTPQSVEKWVVHASIVSCF